MSLSSFTKKNLICPVCQSELLQTKNLFKCSNRKCSKDFPVIKNIPILINEKNSIFSIKDYINHSNRVGDNRKGIFKKIISSLIPSLSNNLAASNNYKKFLELVTSNTDDVKILVIGGGYLGNGMDLLTKNQTIELVEGDVTHGPRTNLIFDGHDIPFRNNSFDGVIIQAVIEHVIDPYRCVAEIYRVLKNDALVYSETPFMQQVHMGKFDFTRFTLLGHRRLFRNFKEINSGIVCGPGMALAWSYRYFLLSFFKSNILRKLVIVFTAFTAFYFKYFDKFLVKKKGSFDAASGYFFLGKKSMEILSDRDLIKQYKGFF